jgi:ubiquinone/menaquinone biosynthesis C-methylase UbiE
MLQAARKKLARHGKHSQVRFLQQDVMHVTMDGIRPDAIFMAYGIRNMPDYERCIENLYRILKPGGKICFHEYALRKSFAAKLYWKCLGYVFIIPLAGLATGSTTMFRYLIKSVEGFLSPEEFTGLLRKAGFENVTHAPLAGWRKPILHTFLAQKPLSSR